MIIWRRQNLTTFTWNIKNKSNTNNTYKSVLLTFKLESCPLKPYKFNKVANISSPSLMQDNLLSFAVYKINMNMKPSFLNSKCTYMLAKYQNNFYSILLLYPWRILRYRLTQFGNKTKLLPKKAWWQSR